LVQTLGKLYSRICCSARVCV